MVVVLGQHLDCVADALDDRSPDEHAGKSPSIPVDRAARLRTTRAGGRRRCAHTVQSSTPSAGGRRVAVVARRAASRISPAHVAERRQAVARARSLSGSRRPDVSSSLAIVVDSPPGRNSASRPLRCSGTRTSTASTPSASSTSRCSRNAPCSARTPAFMTWRRPGRAPRLPAPLGELHVELVDLVAAHRPRRGRARPWRRWRDRRSAWSPRRSPSPASPDRRS